MQLNFLTSTQLSFFQENGYLVIPDFATSESCEALIARAAELVTLHAGEWDQAIFSTKNQVQATDDYFLNSGDKVRLFMEEEEGEGHRVNKIGHAMHDLDPEFQRFSHSEKLAAVASDIGFVDPRLMQSMYIFKQPRIGGEVKCHQDSTFLYTEPLSVVGFWFALQDATLENGCLWALPGGHREPLRDRFLRNGKGGCEFDILDSTPLPTAGYVPLEVKQGTLVLLHGQLPHYSEANRSGIPREAYAIHVVEGGAKYSDKNWLQRKESMPTHGFA